jgi:FkbM family methyltransferase
MSDRAEALALRRTLLELLRQEAGALKLPAGATPGQVHAELHRLEAATHEETLSPDALTEQVRTLAGLLFAFQGPTRPLLERLRAHPFVLPVPGGAVLVDFGLFRDLHTVALGAWEPENLAFMRGRLRPGQTVLDVGAHVGHFTILAASLVGGEGDRPGSGRVLAFEPAPSNLERLRRNLTLGGSAARVEVIPCAVSSRPGTAKFFDDGGTAGTEFSMYAGRHGQAGVAFTAPVDTIDAACHARGVRSVDFMKIDVEGAELEVLAGAAQILRDSPHLSLLVELHPWVVPPEQVVRALEADGFAVYDVKDPGRALPPEAARERFAKGGDLAAVRA